jgi:hypothetical protein
VGASLVRRLLAGSRERRPAPSRRSQAPLPCGPPRAHAGGRSAVGNVRSPSIRCATVSRDKRSFDGVAADASADRSRSGHGRPAADRRSRSELVCTRADGGTPRNPDRPRPHRSRSLVNHWAEDDPVGSLRWQRDASPAATAGEVATAARRGSRVHTLRAAAVQAATLRVRGSILRCGCELDAGPASTSSS